MADEQINIPNEDTQITPSLDFNQWLKRMDTPIKQNSIKVTKVVEPTNKKTLL